MNSRLLLQRSAILLLGMGSSACGAVPSAELPGPIALEFRAAPYRGASQILSPVEVVLLDESREDLYMDSASLVVFDDLDQNGAMSPEEVRTSYTADPDGSSRSIRFVNVRVDAGLARPMVRALAETSAGPLEVVRAMQLGVVYGSASSSR